MTNTDYARHVYQNGYFEDGKMEIRNFVNVDNSVVLGGNVHDVTPLQRFSRNASC